MPKQMIWIRQEDWEAWTNVKDRPAMLHAILQQLKQKQEAQKLKEEPHYEPVE
jgi:hypothetical protein